MPEHNDDHALLTTDRVWWQSFDFQTQELADNNDGQLALWPVDDLMSVKRYVGCPDRGTHVKITECWLCYGDWAWGRARASDLLAPDAEPPASS